MNDHDKKHLIADLEDIQERMVQTSITLTRLGKKYKHERVKQCGDEMMGAAGIINEWRQAISDL